MKKNITRREFMEFSAASMVALSEKPFGKKTKKQKKPVRVAVIGTGNRGRSLLGNLLTFLQELGDIFIRLVSLLCI